MYVSKTSDIKLQNSFMQAQNYARQLKCFTDYCVNISEEM